jgi:hypothetical protein
VKTLALLAVLAVQASQPSLLTGLGPALHSLRDHLAEHKSTFGATPDLTVAKHRLRDWVDSRLAGAGADLDVITFGGMLHRELADANLFCTDLQDECDWNFLGYVDDVRLTRSGGFLTIVTAVGIYCGYDESAYVYTFTAGKWQRLWEHERNTYTDTGYLPQTVHDVQISEPDAAGTRLVLSLGSQTICGGAFKDLYARAWRLDAAGESALALDWTAHANDTYPPLQGRVFPDAVLFQFTTGGLLSGDVHTAVRRFRIDGTVAAQMDPVASLPRDFVAEWLSAPWSESRTRSASASLEARHKELSRSDGVGDTPESTRRCSSAPDLWQVATHLYEKPKRYFRVRWSDGYRFTLVDVSEKPFPDCTLEDERGESYPDLLGQSSR